MSNKLREVFSNQEHGYGCTLTFQDDESNNKFISALKTVFDEGKTVTVDGLAIMSTNIRDGDMAYPFITEMPISQIVVGPAIEPFSIVVDTKHGKMTAHLKKYQTSKEAVIETESNEVVFLRFAHIIGSKNINFTYRLQVKYAKSIKEIFESLQIATGVINHFFNPFDDKNIAAGAEALTGMRKSFEKTSSFFDRLTVIEDEFQLSFVPETIENIEDSVRDVNELFFLMVEKRAVRMSEKLKATEATGVTFEPGTHIPEIGANIEITFRGECTYSIYGQEIHIYTANLLSNAVIKEIITDEEGFKRVLYGDVDSNPMYISCTGFKTEEEAKAEQERIMSDKEKYTTALTVEEYMIAG